MGEQLNLNLGLARQGRDEGIDLVLEHNRLWTERAIGFIELLPHGWLGIAEAWRVLITRSPIGPPKSKNAWGGLTTAVIKRGLVKKTGRRLPMRTEKSHARHTDEYVRL